MFRINTFVVLVLMAFLFGSCKKDKKIETNPSPQPQVEAARTVFNFKALADNLPLIPNAKWYVNANGDSFTVSKFNYYISNIKFKRSDGTIFSENESYHIIKHVEGVTSFTVANIPEGKYTQIEFLIGVDSLHNISGAQTGDLSPDTMMYWGWSSGYIFFKLEGLCKTTNMTVAEGFAMHAGGFSGATNCIRKCSYNLADTLIAMNGKHTKIFYNTSVNEIFINPVNIDFDSYKSVSIGKLAKDVANNYQDMLTIDHIEN